MGGSPELHLRPAHAIPFLFQRARAAMEKTWRGGPQLRGRTSPRRQEGSGEDAAERPHGPRMRCTQQAPGVESSGRIRRPRRECACAVASLSTSASPPPGPPAGAPGPAGPCSAAPAPVGSVSTGRRHAGCPLRAPLRTSLRRLEAAGALGVAGGLGADPPCRRPHLAGSCSLGGVALTSAGRGER